MMTVRHASALIPPPRRFAVFPVTLEELEELLGDGGTTFFKAMAADPLIQDFNKMLDEVRGKGAKGRSDRGGLVMARVTLRLFVNGSYALKVVANARASIKALRQLATPSESDSTS